MSQPSDPIEDAVVVAFLKQVAADRANGTAAVLEGYQARFPGFEAVIAREYAGLAADATASRAHPQDQTRVGLARALRDRRYREIDEIGRGGMGVVLQVWDQHLRRSLAMKVLAEQFESASDGSPRTSSRSLSRFLDEAQITGQLAHPGIVPVHDLGIDEGGRVYFTMSRIQGQNLSEIVGRLHRGDPAWSLARVLGVVLRVCEAVAFAHSKCVIHRDLKPSNVMVGSFGETYVLDWGLARVLGPDGERADERAHADPDAELGRYAAHRTMDGDVIGTPSFMSPEQARGDTENIDTRSDVYSIGAMLYQVLTGEIPYARTATTSSEIVASVVHGPPAPIDEQAQDCAPELIAICRKAMERDPGARYPAVAELADDLRAFLEVRVVRAYETGAIAEARKWIHRNRALAATGAFAILALVLGLAFSLLQKSVADANAARADANATRAEADFSLAHSVVDDMMLRFADRGLLDVPGMETVRGEVIESALGFYRELVERHRADPRSRASIPTALLRVAGMQRELGRHTEAVTSANEAIELLRTECQRDPGSAEFALSLTTALIELSYTRIALGEFDVAGDLLRECVATLDRLLTADPDNPKLLLRKGDVLTKLTLTFSRRGMWEGMLELQHETVAIGERLLALDPDDGDARSLVCVTLKNFGIGLQQLQRADEAREATERAVQLIETAPAGWSETRRTRVLVADVWMSSALLRFSTDADAAAACLDRALAIQRSLTRDFPSVPEHHSVLARTLYNYGNLLAGVVGDVERGVAMFEEAVECHSASIALAPSNQLYQRFLAQTHRWLCELLLRHRQHARAAHHARALGISALGSDPSDPGAADDGAVFMTLCIAAVNRDESLTPEQRESTGESYARDAITLLRAAVDAGLTHLDRDEFELLEDRADFQALRGALAERK